ncbi:hypothetical protein U0E23_34175 [Burkholderia stagnalis]|uniref:hypothetical protein n=1 Tax=Burkholderia stagnalis TaxID=1503054 RepID=UPI002AB34062|nr:hypothetical protein [Burkholderia stagnalis]MDY7807478.1 hypothetical protein [Burkholderia stagnalis]
MAWYELDEWNALGAAGESIKAALEKAAALMRQASADAVKLAVDARARAEFAKMMAKNLDEVRHATTAAVNSVDTSRLDAQMLARVEAMRLELGKYDSFSKIAQEADSLGRVMFAVGRQLGGLISAAQLLWVLKDRNASSHEVGGTAISVMGGIFGGMLGSMLVPPVGTIIVATAAGLAAKFAWEGYIAPNLLNWSETHSPNFRQEISRTIDRLTGTSTSDISVVQISTRDVWTTTTYSNGVRIESADLPYKDYSPGFEAGTIRAGDRWVGYSLKIIAPDGKGGSTTQYIGQSGMVTETNGRRYPEFRV